MFPNVSSVMFYDQKDIGVLSSLSFIPLSLGYFQRSLSCGDCNEKTGQEGQTGRAHVLLFSFCYKNTIPMHPRSQNFRTGRFNRYVVRLQLLNPECSKGELNQFWELDEFLPMLALCARKIRKANRSARFICLVIFNIFISKYYWEWSEKLK